MKDRHLHIISHMCPHPGDYNYLADVFYSIVWLHKNGILIHLHYFGEEEASDDLKMYCHEIHQYAEQGGHKGFSHNVPYIIGSHFNEWLQNNLLKDNYPILLEGISCSYLLEDERFAKRTIMIREQHATHEYKGYLYTNWLSFLKKIHFILQNKLIKQHMSRIMGKAMMAFAQPDDANTYKPQLNGKSLHLPLFHRYTSIASKKGNGYYCLYHGDLSQPENEEMAYWLSREVFDALHVPFIIAGRRPSVWLQRSLRKHVNTCLVADPAPKELYDIIEKTHIHVLPALRKTGITQPIINAIFGGRHCVTNEAVVGRSYLAPACHLASCAKSFREVIKKLYHQPFESPDIALRMQLLEEYYDNEKQAERLGDLLFGG